MKQIQVPLGSRSYQITIGQKTISRLPSGLNKYLCSKKVVFLTNKTIHRLYYRQIKKILKNRFDDHWIIIPDGERYKNLSTVHKIYKSLVKIRADRNTGLVAFGGGVVGDVGGFVAATYLRGLPYIQLPTSLLAQVDSSVGGKTGVDLPAGKNLVGSFYQPIWVLIDTHFLKTLPEREFRCGMSEVVKYGVLWDARFFEFIEKNIGKIKTLKHNTLEKLIYQSVSIKAHIVSKDEKEAGLRSLLNLGHTLGHAIESLSKYKTIHHGEAVSMGMAYATLLSFKKGFCRFKDYERVNQLLKKLDLPICWPNYSKLSYRKAVSIDKKAKEGKINYVAIKKIGKTFCVPLTPREIVSYV